MKSVEERLKSYEPLWENWTYTGEFLGEGAMSSVFEIQSTAMGMREVAALKIITVKKDVHGEIKIPENALNEIKILRTLSGNSNIVNYHDSTQRNIYDDDGNLCEIDILIKMEKLEPLSEGKKLSEEQVIKLAKDMCAALVHASDHGIIHRDIKPQNIFVDNEGEYKLGDFGIAKIVSGLSQQYTMNIGTMAYTAPEVAGAVGGKYDISSDIYSLGLVLYAFLNNGYLPFVKTASSLHEAISKRLSGAAFPSPSGGSKNLKSIVMRACCNDIVKRFKTPQEMLEALELLSNDGKKYVVDPFATLDANIGLDDDLRNTYGKAEKRGIISSDFSGVTETSSVSGSAKSGGFTGGLRINMSKSSSSKTESEKSTATEKDKTVKTGGLTIRMSKSVSKPEEPDEKSVHSKPDELSVDTVKSETVEKTVEEERKSFATSGNLRINMGKSTTSSHSSGLKDKETAKDKKEEPAKKSGSAASFFSTPKSL